MFQIEREFLDGIAEITDPVEAVGAFFETLLKRPSYPRLLGWMLLEGINPTDHIDGFPLVERLVELLATQSSLSEARHRVQLLLAFGAGWTTTQDFMADAAAMSERDQRQAPDWAASTAREIASGPMARVGN